MCTEEFIRMMFTIDLYGTRGLDSHRVWQVCERTIDLNQPLEI